jgi:hypothetical protein
MAETIYLLSARPSYVSLYPEVSCPIQFSSEKKKLHPREGENVDIVRKALKSFRCRTLVPIGGMIDAEDYDQTVESTRTSKSVFINMAESEENKEFYGRIMTIPGRWDLAYGLIMRVTT